MLGKAKSEKGGGSAKCIIIYRPGQRKNQFSAKAAELRKMVLDPDNYVLKEEKKHQAFLTADEGKFYLLDCGTTWRQPWLFWHQGKCASFVSSRESVEVKVTSRSVDVPFS